MPPALPAPSPPRQDAARRETMERELPDLSILRRCWPEYDESCATVPVLVRGIPIGGPQPVIIAGPCAVESFEQTLRIAESVRAVGGRLLRGGVFKPRTNPHDFRGLGLQGLEILAEVRRRTGLGIVTEVMDPRLVAATAEVADMLQVGSRSMQNFPLLTELGRQPKPVLLKRGWASTLEEWLCAAEYVATEGNRQIVLCERGIRASCHWSYARNVLDLNVLEPARRATPLPVIVDPSHATGNWTLVLTMSQAALAAGAHGLLIEVAEAGADRALVRCDAEQGIPSEILTAIAAHASAMQVPEILRLVPEPLR